MPARLTAADRRLLWIAGATALLLLALTAFLGPTGASQDERPTTYSTASGGAKAAYLLLRQSGYQVRRWEQPARELPRGGATLILAEPSVAPTADERRSVQHFLESGGRVIAIGAAGSLFLPDHGVDTDETAALTWKRVPSLVRSRITRAAPEIELAPASSWRVKDAGLALYGTEGRTYVMQVGIGQGEAIWWGAATPLTNAGIRQPGNVEFFLASIGGTDRPILWDEYFHGYRSGGGDFSWSLWPLVGVHLVVAAAAIVLTFSRRSGPVVEPPVENRLSPLEFVRTLGALYGRARAASVAVDIAHQRFRYHAIRRLGLPPDASVEALEKAAADRWGLRDAGFGALLRRAEAARSSDSLTPEAALAITQALADYGRQLDLFPREPELRNAPGAPDKEHA
jgi:hypothetical protein